MSRLLVYSARINSRDPDRFDVTRKTGGPAGVVFAPSWGILRPALEARGEVTRALEALLASPLAGDEAEAAKIRAIFDRAWSVYVPAYLAEMRASYRTHRAAWERLLARPRVVLVCYCIDAEHCHRAILRSRILPALGAVDGGEVTLSAPRRC